MVRAADAPSNGRRHAHRAEWARGVAGEWAPARGQARRARARRCRDAGVGVSRAPSGPSRHRSRPPATGARPLPFPDSARCSLQYSRCACSSDLRLRSAAQCPAPLINSELPSAQHACRAPDALRRRRHLRQTTRYIRLTDADCIYSLQVGTATHSAHRVVVYLRLARRRGGKRVGSLPAVPEPRVIRRLEAEEIGALAVPAEVVALLHDRRGDC